MAQTKKQAAPKAATKKPVAKKLPAAKHAAQAEEKIKIVYLNGGAVQDIPLNEIIPDPNQPRKFFDEKELADLAQSICEMGVIQSILVRKVGKKYMIVFGERRFRSSKIAQQTDKTITTIPARVCELTDEQVLELQITENLQRHDPHPMDEATAFERLAANRDLKEVALRVGRSPKYVAQRLLLTKMIPEFQEMFFLNKMYMEDALLLAKLSPDDQTAILKEKAEKNWKQRKDWILSGVQYMVRETEQDLSKAPFKTEDATLYPEMGACGVCQFNSKNSLTLFIDEKTGRICRNSLCYKIKCQRNYSNRLQEVMADPSIVFVTSYYSDWGKEKEEAEAKIEEVKKLGAVVLKQEEWEELKEEEKFETWSEYKDYNDDWNEDYSDETHEEYLKELKASYEADKKEHDNEIARIRQARKDGKVKKAFVVVGRAEGKIVEILPKEAGISKLSASSGEASEGIAAIEKREARNKELDAEKVYEAVRGLFVSNDNELFKDTGELTLTEKKALMMAMNECIRWNEREYFHEKVLKCEDDPRFASLDHLQIAKAIDALKPEEFEKAFNTCCRLVICEQLFKMGSSHERSDTAYWAMQYAFNKRPNEVNEIQLAQQEKAKKRAEKVQQRIAALQKPAEEKKTKKTGQKQHAEAE